MRNECAMMQCLRLMTVFSVCIFSICGCTTPKYSSYYEYPHTTSSLSRRPITIEVRGWDDKRPATDYTEKFASIFGVFFVPLWPYGTIVRNLGPVVPTQDMREKYPSVFRASKNNSVPPWGYFSADAGNKKMTMNELIAIVPFQADQYFAVVEIPPLLCDYLVQSQLGDKVFLDGDIYSDQRLANPGQAKPMRDDADVVVVPTIYFLKRKERHTFYGLTVFPAAYSIFLLTGIKPGYSIDFEITAYLGGTSGSAICAKRYTFERWASFKPFFGFFDMQYLPNRVYDIIGGDIHSACQDFVAELDRALPKVEDKFHWDSIARERDARIARSEGRSLSEIVIETPADGQVVEQKELFLRARIFSQVAIQSVEARLNGQKIKLANAPSGTSTMCEFSAEEKIIATFGPNVLQITAVDQTGIPVSRQIQFRCLSPEEQSRIARKQDLIKRINELIQRADSLDPKNPQIDILRLRLKKVEEELAK